jgi:hypothetical protein
MKRSMPLFASYIVMLFCIQSRTYAATSETLLSRPILGYAEQASPPEIRAILGVPGSATLSELVPTPPDTIRVHVAPRQDYALLESSSSGLASLLLNGVSSGQVVPVPGALSSIDFVTFSPFGRSAVLASRASGRMQVITGLPLTPKLINDINPGLLPGFPDSVAVSDSGSSVLLAAAGLVYSVLADGSFAAVVSVSRRPTIAFLPASTTAAIGDPAAGSLYLFQSLTSGIVAPVLASGLTELGEIAGTGDGLLLYVTDRRGRRMWSVTVANGLVREFDLPVSATRLERLRNSDTFLISFDATSPAWVFFRRGEDAGTVFVPALRRDERFSRLAARDHGAGVEPKRDQAAVAAIAIATVALPSGAAGVPYTSVTLQAQGGAPPYSWSAVGLPAGLALSPGGVLSGSPTLPGPFNTTVAVSDSSSPRQSASGIYTVTILPSPSAFSVTISAQPLTITDQPVLAVKLSEPYPLSLRAALSLSFSPAAAGLPTSGYLPDGSYPGAALQFASGGTSTTFAVDAGSTSSIPVAVQIGDVAGTIRVMLTSLSTQGGDTVTLASPLSLGSIAVPRLAPITAPGAVQITNLSATGFSVDLVATSTPRDLSSVTFSFSPAAGTQLNNTSFAVSLSDIATAWFASNAGQAAGGAFDLTVPFPFSGDMSAIGSVSVALTNSVGASSPESGGVGGGVMGGICPTFIQAPPLARSLRAAKAANGLIARIAVPVDGALVRSDIPIFGEAAGADFKEYRVEYGEGANPSKWTLIGSSKKPQPVNHIDLTDAQSMQGDMDIRGNLTTWNTGLKEWVHLPWHPADDPTDLRGEFTLRLVVTNSAGKSVEDRVTLEVGRVISQVLPGDAISTDNRVTLHFDPQSIPAPFRVYSIKPLTAGVPATSAKLERIGSAYSIREPGDEFLKAVKLRFSIEGATVGHDLAHCSIHEYDPKTLRWIALQTFRGFQPNTLETSIYRLPEPVAYYAALCGTATESLALPKPKLSRSTVPGSSGTLAVNTFEEDAGQWTARDRGFGGTVTRDRTATPDGTYCLKITNESAIGDFAVTAVSTRFRADIYPIVTFDYRIGPGIKTDFYARIGDRWFRIGFTGDEVQFRNTDVGIASIGRIEGIISDGQWHSASFDLNRMLAEKTARRSVEELIMANWRVGGYMKLEFGGNPRGASFYIDNFKIRRAEQTIPAAEDSSTSLLIDDFAGPAEFNRLGGSSDVFSEPGASNVSMSRVAASSLTGRHSKAVLSLRYDVTHSGAYGGYWTQLRGLRADRFDQIRMRIKATSSIHFLVGLKRHDGVEVKANADSYWGPMESDGWREVSIPLAAFGSPTERSALEVFSIAFTNAQGNQKGELLVDAIRLERGIFPVLIADFERDAAVNRLMQKNWVFSRGAAALAVSLQKADSASGSQALRLSYGGTIGLDLGSGEFSYAGWVAGLNALDASGGDSLKFKIRGQAGGERFNVYLDDGVTRKPVDSAKYFAIGTDWKDVSIPLSAFERQGVDLSQLQELQFVFEWQPMSGTVYLDDIRITGGESRNEAGVERVSNGSGRQ